MASFDLIPDVAAPRERQFFLVLLTVLVRPSSDLLSTQDSAVERCASVRRDAEYGQSDGAFQPNHELGEFSVKLPVPPSVTCCQIPLLPHCLYPA